MPGWTISQIRSSFCTPTTARSSGTDSPASWAARMKRQAVLSFQQNTPVGRGTSANHSGRAAINDRYHDSAWCRVFVNTSVDSPMTAIIPGVVLTQLWQSLGWPRTCCI